MIFAKIKSQSTWPRWELTIKSSQFRVDKLESFAARSVGKVFKGYSSQELESFAHGELYFSSVPAGQWKDWRTHKDQDSLIIVVRGPVSFELHSGDEEEISEILVEEMHKLTIFRGIWFRFIGLDYQRDGLVCNLTRPST